jgi:hypothetical protein
MKTTNLIKLSTFIFWLGLASCTKEAVDETVDTSQSAFETEASVLSDEIEKSADAVSFEKDLLSNNNNSFHGWMNGPLPACATVSITYPEGGSFPKVITIDYGEENCQVRPNLYKRGKIIISLSDSIINLNASRTVTFDSFYINDMLVTGQRLITNIGPNEDGYIVFSIDNDFSIGDWNRVATGSKIWLEGLGSQGYEDNVFLLTGSSVTTRANGMVITRTIVEALRVDRSCNYITEGVLNITWDDNEASIDFGDGTCDDVAIITRNGQEFEIELNQFGCHRRFN